MTEPEARAKAQTMADELGCSVLVYRSLLPSGGYGAEFTLPMYGERVGQRCYPQTQTSSREE